MTHNNLDTYEETIKKEFEKFCTTDNFSAPPYETDTISDWWLSQIRQRDEALKRAVMNLTEHRLAQWVNKDAEALISKNEVLKLFE